MPPIALQDNVLFYGDNLDILRRHIPDESIDLIYLDPPFNSSRNYNVLFKDEQGKDSEAQIIAFEDTWHWNVETEHLYFQLTTHSPEKIACTLQMLRTSIGTNQMLAYLHIHYEVWRGNVAGTRDALRLARGLGMSKQHAVDAIFYGGSFLGGPATIAAVAEPINEVLETW